MQKEKMYNQMIIVGRRSALKERTRLPLDRVSGYRYLIQTVLRSIAECYC